MHSHHQANSIRIKIHILFASMGAPSPLVFLVLKRKYKTPRRSTPLPVVDAALGPEQNRHDPLLRFTRGNFPAAPTALAGDVRSLRARGRAIGRPRARMRPGAFTAVLE